MNEYALEHRHLFMKCLKGRHEKCPGQKYRDTYESDKTIGKIRTGRTIVFCECPCHAIIEYRLKQ